MKTTSFHPQTNGRRIAPGFRTNIRALSVGLALMAFGSATARSAGHPDPPPPPSAPVGKVGIAYGGSLPGFDLQIPDTRNEAAEDRSVRLGLSWAADLNEGLVQNELQAIGVYLRMALTPVGMLAGGGYGAFAGESAGKVNPALTILTNAMAELQVQEALRQQLLILIRERSLQPVVLLTNYFPAETAFRVPTLMDDYAPVDFSFVDREQQKDCDPSAFNGIDTLLMVRVVNQGLSGPDGHNSDLSLNMAVRATLIRAQDRTQLSGFYAQYESERRKFVLWTTNNAAPFRAEMERGLQSLAGQIVTQSGLHLPQTPPPNGIVQASVKPGK